MHPMMKTLMGMRMRRGMMARIMVVKPVAATWLGGAVAGLQNNRKLASLWSFSLLSILP
jgi:hypothetical protein